MADTGIRLNRAWVGDQARFAYAYIMPNRSRKKKPARDFNQIARAVVDQATGGATLAKNPARPKNNQDAAAVDRAASEGMAQPQGEAPKKKNPAAVALGRKGGLKGGKARAAKLTKEQRIASAKKAAQARWKKRDNA